MNDVKRPNRHSNPSKYYRKHKRGKPFLRHKKRETRELFKVKLS